MVVTDIALADIRTSIAEHRPERGGALYGPKDYPLVTHFEFDAEARTTSVSYVPSVRLIQSVRNVERETGLRFKGIVHSHPLGYDRPSEGDRASAANLFRHNSHLSSIAMPIVQQVNAGGNAAPEGFIRWFAAERRQDEAAERAPAFLLMPDRLPDVEILDEEVHVLPIRGHMERLLSGLAGSGYSLRIKGALQPLRIRHAQLVGMTAASDEGHEFMYFVSMDYPVVPPLVLYQSGGTTRNLRPAWDGMDEDQRMLDDIVELLAEEWRVPPRRAAGDTFG